LATGWPVRVRGCGLPLSRGRQKIIDGPPVHLLKPRPTHQPTFFPLFFLQYVFERFSARGVQKHQKNVFAKSPCRKTIPKQIDKNFDVRNASFSSIFLFYRGFGRFSAMGVNKNTTTKCFAKKTRRKAFTFTFTKNRPRK
jgi:hypothetical protein